MARDWVRLPSYSSKEEAEKYLPDGWQVFQIEQLYEQLPVGKRFEQKTSLPVGSVPVIDQSAAGIVGWHNEEPGVLASPENPAVTFANHTCEMRLMEESFSVIQNVFPLIGRNGVCQTRFLYYLTKGRVWLEEYKGHFPDFRRKWVCCPPDKEQEQLVKVFGDLDEKINLNRRINQTLEAMAQAIFKSWFVDFDPVKAKIAAIAEGRDPLRAAMSAISGKADAELDALPPEQYEYLAATAALIPDEMEETELGDIPKGWAFQSAETLAEVGIGKTPPRKEPQWFTEGEGDWRWVSIKDMGASGVFQQRSSEFLTADAVSRFNVRVVPDRTVLLSFKLTIGRVAITDGPMVTNEAIAHFKLPSNDAISSEYLYLYLKGFDYSTLGSTSSIADAVNSKTIREMPIIVASRDLIDRFTKSVAPLFEEMRNRQNEIASLGATRDTLLPKLLSGEIEVPV